MLNNQEVNAEEEVANQAAAPQQHLSTAAADEPHQESVAAAAAAIRNAQRRRQENHKNTPASSSPIIMHRNKNHRRRYYSRRKDIKKQIPAIPLEEWVGYCSPWALLWGCIFLSIPIAYMYIALVVLRELCAYFPETLHAGIILPYLPFLARLIHAMQSSNKSSKLVEIWCILEAIFYIGLKLHISWLQTRDTLEASLSAAPISSLHKRRILWQRMMALEKCHLDEFLRGWFFDTPRLDNISKYDVLDFLTWSLFEGRHQEHLTNQEQVQLESFVEELEWRISLQLYGSSNSSSSSCVYDDADESNAAAESSTTADAAMDTATSDATATDTDAPSTIQQQPDRGSGTTMRKKKKQAGKLLVVQTTEQEQDEDDTTEYYESTEHDYDDSYHFSPIQHRQQQQHQHEAPPLSPPSCRFSPRPKKMFHFPDETLSVDDDYYEDYLESTRHAIIFLRHLLYDSYKQLAERAATVSSSLASDNIILPCTPTRLAQQFHPVQDWKESTKDLRKNMAQQMERAEESALQIYQRLVPSGSQMDKQLQAITHAMQNEKAQFTEAYWNSVCKVQERLESVQQAFGKQRVRIQQQMRSYRVMLNRMLDFEMKDSGDGNGGGTGSGGGDGDGTAGGSGDGGSNSRLTQMLPPPPSKQIAHMMRRITECNEALERLETRAHSTLAAFLQPLLSQLPTPPTLFESSEQRDPQRYAKYNSDPIIGVATYPLGFHLLLLGGTEIPLRIMLHQRGFQRKTIGPVAYYVHAGGGDARLRKKKRRKSNVDDDALNHVSLDVKNHAENKHEDVDYLDHHDDDDDDDDGNVDKTPIVFVHGIGIGLISYIPLIDALLKSKRPIFLPEIPYVMGFRPWQSPNAVLPPNVVCSCMTVMLASHGFLCATWMGHSYGTSWLSYMCQYASHAVAALLFLDPICFCLHVPRLTKSFVYTRRDPGTISYIVRTDVIVNWTIQRSFPWSWIILFTEQIKVPCSVFLSDKDALVPAGKIEDYLKSQNIPVRDIHGTTQPPKSYFEDDSELINCSVFRGHGHGRWTEVPNDTVPLIAMASEVLCERAEKRTHQNNNKTMTKQHGHSLREVNEETPRHPRTPTRIRSSRRLTGGGRVVEVNKED